MWSWCKHMLKTKILKPAMFLGGQKTKKNPQHPVPFEKKPQNSALGTVRFYWYQGEKTEIRKM